MKYQNEKLETIEFEGKMENTNRGITLISLVVTVIVMLIIAGISLAMLNRR